MKIKLILLFVLSLFLTGCDFDKFIVMNKKDWEAEKAAIVKQFGDKYDKQIADIEKKRLEKEVLEAANGQAQAGDAYGIYMLSNIKPQAERTRPDTLINLKSRDLVARLPALTTENLLKTNDELKKELDETLTKLSDLQVKYDHQLEVAKADKDAITAKQKEIDDGTAAAAKIKADKDHALLDLADAKSKQDDADKAKLTEQASNKAERERLIKYLIMIFVAAGALTGIAAYGLKSLTLAAVAAGAFGIAIAIPFIETWMVLSVGALLVTIAVGAFGYKWWQTHKNGLTEKALSDRLVGSIEDLKTKMGVDKFNAEIVPHIQDWMKDMPQLEAKIQAKRKELNLV